MFQSLGSEAVKSSVLAKRGQRQATGLSSWKVLGFNGAGQGGFFGEIIKAQELSNATPPLFTL